MPFDLTTYSLVFKTAIRSSRFNRKCTIRPEKTATTTITIGKRGTYYAEVLDGLEEGDVVVIHPTNDLEDDMRVKVMK